MLSLPASLLDKLHLLPQNSDYAAPIDSAFSGNFLGIATTYAIVAFLNGVVAAYLTVQVWDKTNLWLALIVTGVMLQPWSLAINGSIYWFMSIKFLPAITLILVRKFTLSKHYSRFIIFLAFVIAFASVYEFATVVVVDYIATDYVLNPNRYKSYKRVITSICFSLLFSIISLISTLTIHLMLLSMKGVSLNSAFDSLTQTINKRTGASKVAVPVEYLDSLSVSPIWVLKTYLDMPIFGAPYKLGLLNTFTVAFLVIAIFLLSLYKFENVNRFFTVEVWLICLSGPIAWYLLARPHSAGHTHIDFALWYLPTLPLGFAIIVDRIQKSKFEFQFRPRKPLIVWAHFLVFVLILYFFSLYTVRL